MQAARLFLSILTAVLLVAAGGCTQTPAPSTTPGGAPAADPPTVVAAPPKPMAKPAAPAAEPVLLRVADDPTVSLMVRFKVGAQDDPPGKAGLAALVGALVAEGATTKNSREQILEKLYPLAASYSVRVDREVTTLDGRTHRDNLDTFYELFADAYLRPAFTEADFERLKADQLNFLEKTLRYASDEDLAKAALRELLFAGTGYRHPIVGTVDGLKSITLEDVRRFYALYYTRGNAVVGLGGGFSDALRDRFAASLDELPSSIAPAGPPMPPAIELDDTRVLLVAKPNADASISFGYPIDVRRGSREFYALWIANSWLGEHRNSSSHLYKVIRETRGMNYGDYAYIEAFPEGGFRQMPPTGVPRRQQIFEVWIRTLPNEQAHFALRAAVRELDKLVKNGMSEETFELTRAFLTKYYLHYAETTHERLGYRLDDRFYGIEGDGHLAQFADMMASMTREEVNAAVRKHLRADRLAIAIVTGEAESLRDALVADAPSPMTYASPKPPEVVDEDREIERYPLEIDAGAVRIVPVDKIFEQ